MIGFPGQPTRTAVRDGLTVPLCYGPVHEEYETLQNGAGLVDCANESFLRAEGPDAASFLQGMVTADVRRIALHGRAASWILDANGKILALIAIHRIDEKAFLLQTPPAMAEEIGRILDKYIIMENVTLAVVPELACLSLQGPLAAEHAAEAGTPAILCAANDRCGQGGFDLIAEKSILDDTVAGLLAAGCRPAGMDALDISRVESFLPRFGQDMLPGENPLVYGLADRVSNNKGCYIGQETVAMTRDRGHPSRLMVLLKSDGPELTPAGTALLVSDKEAGTMTTTVSSPKFGANLALAAVGFRFAQEGATLTDPHGQSWEILQISAYKA